MHPTPAQQLVVKRRKTGPSDMFFVCPAFLHCSYLHLGVFRRELSENSHISFRHDPSDPRWPFGRLVFSSRRICEYPFSLFLLIHSVYPPFFGIIAFITAIDHDNSLLRWWSEDCTLEASRTANIHIDITTRPIAKREETTA